MIDGRKFFDQPIKNDKKTYEVIRKIATGQGGDYTTGFFLMITIDLSKQRALDANPKAIQQINFTVNLNDNNNRLIFFIIKEAKKPFQIFHKGL